MKKPHSPARVCRQIGLALFLMMLVWYITVNGASIVAGFWIPALLENAWFLWAMNDIPLYVLGLPVFLLVLSRLPNAAEPARYRPPLGPGRFAMILLFCLGAGYLLNMLANLILQLLTFVLPVDGLGLGALELLLEEGGWLSGLLFGVLVPAVGEEFLFRYLLWRKLRGAGDKIYIFFSAFCFSLFHANFVQMPYTFVIGAALAWMYTLTGRLWLSMLVHFIINLMGVVVMPLLLEYRPELASLYSFAAIALMIPTAVALFFAYRQRVMVALRPPTEPGWPHRQSLPPRHTLRYGPAWPADPTYALGYPPPAAVPAVPPGGSPYGLYRPLERQPALAGPAAPAGLGAPALCLQNVGMVLYMVLAGLMMLVNLGGMLLL